MEENKTANNLYHIHITSKRNLFSLNLKEVWKYRDLIWMFTKRSFTLTYKQTILGPAWILLNPFITSVIFSVVFGDIAGLGPAGIPQLLFYMCSNGVWNFFASCVNGNASTFTANAAVFGKVYFPRLTTPLSKVLSAIINFGIQFLMISCFLVYYLFRGAVCPNWWAWLLIPLVVIHLGLLGMGIGIIISSMTTKYRDLSILVGFGVQLWMYATPVVYPLSQIQGGWLKTVVLINPVTAPMEVFRYAVLGQGDVSLISLVLSVIITLACVIFGIMVFNKVEKTFMDTV
ncbi:MAG: ABC transporter permease [Ruminococcaceae bacterium]|nr:ABC transporter permease [Oscillospiraceae bacterium]